MFFQKNNGQRSQHSESRKHFTVIRDKTESEENRGKKRVVKAGSSEE